MNQLDEIAFWSRQLSEHALFFSLGLELEPYKSQAKALHADWERARAALAGAGNVATAQALVYSPTVNLQTWQTAVAQLQGSQWIGWLPPLFWDHTLRELQYFVARAWGGGLPPETTLAQNLRFMREHAEFAAHLLDPSQGPLIAGAVGIAREFAAVEAQCCAALTPTLLALSTRAGQDLDAYLTGQPVASPAAGTIHPVLADHVVREGRRYLATLGELGA